MFLWLGVVKVASLHAWTLTRLEFLLTNLELPHLQIKEANETNELHNTSFHFPWNNIQVQCTSTTVSHRGKTFQNDLILYTMACQAYHRLQNIAVWNSHFQCSIQTETCIQRKYMVPYTCNKSFLRTTGTIFLFQKKINEGIPKSSKTSS